MSTQTSYNAFNEAAILDAVNRDLKQAGSRTVVKQVLAVGGDLNNQILMKSTRGSHIVAKVFSPGNMISAMGIRGIHRLKRKNVGYSILFNGQAGRNLETLTFSGENGERYYASKDACLQCLSTMWPSVEDTVRDERLSWEAKGNPVIQREIAA